MGSITKGIGNVLKTAAPFAQFVPGLNYAGAFGAGAGLLGSMLSGGGKKKKGGLSPAVAGQNELLSYILPWIRDPGSAVSAFGDQAQAAGARYGSSLGGLLAEETGNPNALAATRLHAANQATEATNQFGYNVMSPQGRAEAASAALPLFTGVENQHLQRYQLGQQYRQPTFWNQLFSVGAGALPYVLDNWGDTFGHNNGNNVGSTHKNTRIKRTY